MALKRRSTRSALRAKRRRVLAQSKAVSKQLQQTLASGGKGSSAQDIKALRSTLGSLRADVMRGGGSNAKLVASALSDLDTSLAAMAKAGAAKNPNTALLALQQGSRALEDADRKARAAGNDWPL